MLGSDMPVYVDGAHLALIEGLVIRHMVHLHEALVAPCDVRSRLRLINRKVITGFRVKQVDWRLPFADVTIR